MKLNKFLIGLLIVPALSFTSCNDYEDVEVDSPQAGENAIGANFTGSATSIVVLPEADKFTLTLNRVNTKGAATVPVTVAKCDEVAPGVKFCDQPSAFLFADGQATSTVELKFNSGCLFQKAYSMTLSIGTEKDHPYAAGTSSTVVSFARDYTWKDLSKPVILENDWYKGGILALVQWGKDYKDDSKRKLCRIKGLYSEVSIAPDVTLGKDEQAEAYKKASAGSIQFYLDENYVPAGMLTVEGYNPSEINTGILQNEKTGVYFMMKMISITKEGNTYTFKYDIFYKENGEVKTKLSGVAAILEYDFKKTIEELK